jgi:iron complex outermembrane receptor protein
MRTTGLPLCIALIAAAAPAVAADLEPIVVTATRAPQALIDFAGTVSTVEGDAIELTGATHHSEAMNRTSGTMIQRGSGQESLTAIRSPVLTGAGSCGAFLFLEDGVPIRPIGFCNVNQLFEVNSEQAGSIEILRGPGSALYGSNAVHGVINVIPPSIASLPTIGLRAEVGDDYLRGRLVAGHSGANGGVGVLLHATHDGGWRDATGFDEQKVTLLGSRNLADGATLDLRFTFTNLEQETGGFIQGKGSYAVKALAESNANPEAYRDAWSTRLVAHYSKPLDDGHTDLRVVLRRSAMDFLQHFLLGKPLERNGQKSAGFLWSREWRGDRHRVLAGVDGEFADGYLIEDQAGPTLEGSPAARAIRPAGRHYDYTVRSWMIAPYLHYEQRLGDRLTATLGLRGERVAYDYDNRMLDGNTAENGTPCPGGCLYSRPADRKDRFTNVGPRLGLSYRLTDDDALYATLSRGYRPPEATELYRLQRQQSLADLASERMTGGELGYRHVGDGLRLSLVGYWFEKRNVILRDSNAFNVSAGRTRHRGVEAEGSWLPAAGWRVDLAASYAWHQYRFTSRVEQGEQITAGNDIDTAPRRLANARVVRTIGPFEGELEWQYVGAYYADAANTARYGGHHLANLRARYRIGEDFSIGLRVMNLFDRAYADRADLAFGNWRYFPGRGRTAFVDVAWARR